MGGASAPSVSDVALCLHSRQGRAISNAGRHMLPQDACRVAGSDAVHVFDDNATRTNDRAFANHDATDDDSVRPDPYVVRNNRTSVRTVPYVFVAKHNAAQQSDV